MAPHVLPVAGLVDVCLFDKTGTITADELVCEGWVGLDSDSLGLDSDSLGLDSSDVEGTYPSKAPKAPKASEEGKGDKKGICARALHPLPMQAMLSTLEVAGEGEISSDGDGDDSKGGCLMPVMMPLTSLSQELQSHIAVCHSLSLLDPISHPKRDQNKAQNSSESEIVGDPLEVALFDSLNSLNIFNGSNGSRATSASDREGQGELKEVEGEVEGKINNKWQLDRGRVTGPAGIQYDVLRRFSFDPKLRLMSVAVGVIRDIEEDRPKKVPGRFNVKGKDEDKGLCKDEVKDKDKEKNEGRREMEKEGQYKDQQKDKNEGRREVDVQIVCKGSPEAVFRTLCAAQRDNPEFQRQYQQTHQALSRVGKRVIAFASKSLLSRLSGTRSSESNGYSGYSGSGASDTFDTSGSGGTYGVHGVHDVNDLKRSEAESDLTFSGFCAFSCPLRADSAEAVSEILEAGISVKMVTGDALLTAGTSKSLSLRLKG